MIQAYFRLHRLHAIDEPGIECWPLCVIGVPAVVDVRSRQAVAETDREVSSTPEQPMQTTLQEDGSDLAS